MNEQVSPPNSRWNAAVSKFKLQVSIFQSPKIWDNSDAVSKSKRIKDPTPLSLSAASHVPSWEVLSEVFSAVNVPSSLKEKL
mgnify:CR=1 FL=1